MKVSGPLSKLPQRKLALDNSGSELAPFSLPVVWHERVHRLRRMRLHLFQVAHILHRIQDYFPACSSATALDSSRRTSSDEKAGMQTATYSAPWGSGVL